MFCNFYDFILANFLFPIIMLKVLIMERKNSLKVSHKSLCKKCPVFLTWHIVTCSNGPLDTLGPQPFGLFEPKTCSRLRIILSTTLQPSDTWTHTPTNLQTVRTLQLLGHRHNWPPGGSLYNIMPPTWLHNADKQMDPKIQPWPRRQSQV